MITIVDSGGANIASIIFALKRLGVTAQLSCDAEVIRASSHVILPGVGSAETAMRRLQQCNLVGVLQSLTQPVLGICLGMQLLFDFSEEGSASCLGIIPGKIKKIADQPDLSVPHMGWNRLTITQSHLLTKGVDNHAYMYFAHSYVAPITEYTCSVACYGENFSAVVAKNNFFGTQFHPERSSEMGAKILRNFLEL